MRRLFLKLDTNVVVLLLSCAPGPPTLSILFLGNFFHGIAFISQNKNRLTSFRRMSFVSGHFEPVIEPTNADAPDTQLKYRLVKEDQFYCFFNQDNSFKQC